MLVDRPCGKPVVAISVGLKEERLSADGLRSVKFPLGSGIARDIQLHFHRPLTDLIDAERDLEAVEVHIERPQRCFRLPRVLGTMRSRTLRQRIGGDQAHERGEGANGPVPRSSFTYARRQSLAVKRVSEKAHRSNACCRGGGRFRLVEKSNTHWQRGPWWNHRHELPFDLKLFRWLRHSLQTSCLR